MYFPSSIGGEHSVTAILGAFCALFLLLGYLAWKRGICPELGAFISLPIMFVLVGCTLWTIVSRPLEVDLGLFLKFGALALVLALDLRELRLGAIVEKAFFVVNSINILGGFAIVVGSDWIAEFLPKYYWTSDPKLVPLMLSLHKPVLTFGSHALAGLFVYLFFFANWEDYRARRSTFGLVFALCYFFLLLGLTSFTSLGFAALALAQMFFLCWKRNRKLFLVVGLCVAAMIPFAAGAVADGIAALVELPQLEEEALLNPNRNGPLSRFASGGTLRGEIEYLLRDPLSPVGLERSESAFEVESTAHFFIGDSGPLEYLVRGSVPLLVLIYFGLYRFLRGNLAARTHVVALFLVIIAFETGFSALTSSRTLFLLPFLVVYLNHTASVSVREPLRAAALSEC